MSQELMIEVHCDGPDCTRWLREIHWVGLPLQSMMGRTLRLEGWVKMKEGSAWRHLCPDHKDGPVSAQAPGRAADRMQKLRGMPW